MNLTTEEIQDIKMSTGLDVVTYVALELQKQIDIELKKAMGIPEDKMNIPLTHLQKKIHEFDY